MRKSFSLSIIAILALATGGCGGGSDEAFQTPATGGNGGGGNGAQSYSMGNGTGSSFESGTIDVGIGGSQLPAGGATGLSVTIVDQAGTLYTGSDVIVTFNSGCIASGLAQIVPAGGSAPATTVETGTGRVDVTYSAKGCSGTDSVTASATVGTQSLTATADISIAAASIGSIQFQSASPTTIGLKGTGLGETSTVIFKVVDSTGGPRPGVDVSFALNSTVGGLTLSPTNATSAADGTVQTVVSSGTVHTAVRVTASISSPALSTQSSVLTVTTGLPASGAFSIAVGPADYGSNSSNFACSNVEGFNVDGVTVPITVRLADRYNNPSPNGTAVAFYTNGGHIEGSCQTPSGGSSTGTVDGTCTVNWTSANPRPMISSNPPVMGDGRAQILATAIGEESFNDANANGFYDNGEAFNNLGEPFLDENESGIYNLGEYFLDFNSDQQRAAPSGTFKGITCTGNTAQAACSTETLSIGVSHMIIMSTSGADISFVSAGGAFTGNGSGLTIQPQESGSITFNVQDLNGNSMAAGTVVQIVADSAIGTATQVANSGIVPCDDGVGGQSYSASFVAGNPQTGTANGNITIQVTSPSGTLTSRSVPVTIQ